MESLGSERPPWQTIVDKKREIRNQLIEPYAGSEITGGNIVSINDVDSLAERIAKSELTARDVALAYIQKAVHAHEKTNCLTEILFDDALRRANELDEYLSKHGKTVGPLHGVVMTLKDQFDVQSFDTTIGYVGRALRPATQNSLLVDILRVLGCLIIAKSNLPQSIMWCESFNNLWGLTTHPLDPNLTPGGSTGGEGALLAEYGSLVGWGTDIGGSVRIPAHMNGLYSLKPSSGRLPYEGCQVSTAGQEHVPSVVGPMARSLASIEKVTKLVIGARPWEHDPTCHPLEWREDSHLEIQSRPLVVGLLVDDGCVKVHPPIERVLLEVAEKLRQAGHVIVPWTSDGHQDAIDIMDKYYTADGGEDIKRDVAASGEPFIPHVQALVSRAPAISVYEYWALNRQKRAVQKQYLEKWNRAGPPKVDVLLTPVMPHPAVPHGSCKWVGYTKVWNLLDYTALVLPAGKVDKFVDVGKDDPGFSLYEPRSEVDGFNWSLYDPDAMHGLPIGIQVVGRRLEEEKVLGAGKVIDDLLRRAGS
ncbi:related to acetamidase [Ramularia collo-cygni]|uniref:Related to acetamidase n=1 Tax=Ramularia collo-cygni TaxID=112498 RepID=A0A2D3VD23_9PEZI|nr:related to acetamidase [Ramularia collo-cygni]CZT21676.1 related to acetamidase [Ramularia collo-cygni]